MARYYTITMLIFSGCILIYAAITAITKDTRMIWWQHRHAAKMRDKDAYMTAFSKILALTAAVPALSGVTALWWDAAAGPVFVAGFAVVLRLGSKLMKDV